jgi:hypothetical protein
MDKMDIFAVVLPVGTTKDSGTSLPTCYQPELPLRLSSRDARLMI